MAIDKKQIDSTVIANYGSFQALVTAIGADLTALVIAEDVDLDSASVTLPTNIDLLTFANGAKFTNGTLTINKMSARPIHQVFDSSVTVTFNYSAIVLPEWWGALTGIDSSSAIQKAINSINSKNGTVLLFVSDYTITSGSLSNCADVRIVDLSGSTIFTKFDPATVTEGVRLSGHIDNGSVRLTPLGGIAVKLTNNSGADIAQGAPVKPASSTDYEIIITSVGDVNCIGFAYEAISNGYSGWVVISGKCYVLVDGDGASYLDYIRIPISEDANGENGKAHAASLSEENGIDTIRKKGYVLEERAGSGLVLSVIG